MAQPLGDGGLNPVFKFLGIQKGGQSGNHQRLDPVLSNAETVLRIGFRTRIMFDDVVLEIVIACLPTSSKHIVEDDLLKTAFRRIADPCQRLVIRPLLLHRISCWISGIIHSYLSRPAMSIT